MNGSRLSATVLVAALVLTPLALAMSFPPGDPRITLDGKLNCPYISTHGGTAYLQITLTTSDMARPDRRPMNIAVVLDRSGSMGDARKMEYAKQALLKLIDQLDRGDIFSLVIYDDIVEVPFRADRVESKSALKRMVEGIYPRGSTNLGGGMIEGFRQAERNLRKEYVNRVVLLSDGLANRGIIDPYELNRLARGYRERSISLTTMGVGLEYNENLMVGLSEAGGGNYYFIESPYGLASIMDKELNTLSCVVAQNAFIELRLGRGVQVADVIGCDYRGDDRSFVVPVGDLYANDHREFTVELSIPEGHGTLQVVTGELKYDSARMRLGRAPSFAARVHYTSDAAVIEKNKDWNTQAKADVAVSTRTVDQAMKLLDDGKQAEAEQTLNEAKEALAASPAAEISGGGRSIIQEQTSKLEGYSDLLRDKSKDSRLAKKAIQFGNYKTQKQK